MKLAKKVFGREEDRETVESLNSTAAETQAAQDRLDAAKK